jgi:uncharacterized protein (UPF0332 family)
MISSEIQKLLDKADESHIAAKVLIDNKLVGFSAAQSYYTMFYLAEAMLLSKGLSYSSHSAVIASFGKEFARTNLINPKYHRCLIIVQKRRVIGHYGAEPDITDEQALESFQWAGEFMEAVKVYLSKM